LPKAARRYVRTPGADGNIAASSPIDAETSAQNAPATVIATTVHSPSTMPKRPPSIAYELAASAIPALTAT